MYQSKLIEARIMIQASIQILTYNHRELRRCLPHKWSHLTATRYLHTSIHCRGLIMAGHCWREITDRKRDEECFCQILTKMAESCHKSRPGWPKPECVIKILVCFFGFVAAIVRALYGVL